MIKILGVDAGLAHLGWAILALDRRTCELIDSGVIITEKAKKKVNVSTSEDTVRRLTEQLSMFESILKKHKPSIVAIEAFSHLRNASASAKYGMSFASVITSCRALELPILQITSSEAKFKTTGKKSASKQEVINAVSKEFKNVCWPKLSTQKKSDDVKEHVADSIAIAWASTDKELVRFARMNLRS